MKTKGIALTFGLMLTCGWACAQERLTPYAFTSDYDHTCMEKLLAPQYDFFFMRQPSFHAESAFSMRRLNRPCGGAMLFYSVANESIWYSKKRKRVKVTTSEMNVPDSVAWRLQDVFNDAINTASYWADQRCICDGVLYYFGRRYAGGEVHSPEEGSRTQRLVAAMDSISLAVLRSDTALLLRQLPLLDSIDRCYREDHSTEAFYPEFTPYTFTDTNGVLHLQFYRHDAYLKVPMADSLEARQKEGPMLDFFKRMAREVFVRYPNGKKLEVLVDANYTEPRCVVKQDNRDYSYDYYKDMTYYTLYLPPEMLSLERCIKALELPVGEHPIE